MLHIDTTYSLYDDESIEQGDSFESGFIAEYEQVCFRDLVERLCGCEPSQYPLPENPDVFLWYRDSTYNEGTRENIEEGIIEERSYHACDERTARYMLKAYKLANHRG